MDAYDEDGALEPRGGLGIANELGRAKCLSVDRWRSTV